MKFRIFFLLITFFTVSFARNVSTQEMISQMIVVGFSGAKPGDKWVEQVKRDIRGKKIGGIYIAKENVKNFGQVKRVVKYLQDASKKPLLVLSRPSNYREFTTENSSFNLNSIKNVNKIFYQNLRRAGINMLFWPNADIYSNPSHGDQEDIIVTYLMYEIKVLRDEDIVPVIGHFPGKVAKQNSWEFSQLKPYFELIKHNKIDAIALDSSINRKLDSSNIATFSSRIVRNVLREKLKFRGLIFSGDLKSSKIYKRYEFRDIVIKAVNAGVDILFFSSYFANSTNVPREARAIIIDAINSGKIKKEQIRKSYEKIIKFKKRLKR